MTSSRADEISVALEIADNMLEQAMLGEWDQVNALQIKQGDVLHAIFDANVRDIDQNEVEKLVIVQSRLQQVTEMAVQQRAEIAEQVRKLKKGGNVHKAYTQKYDSY